MSVSVMAWVWAYSTTSGNDRLALLCLADEADDLGGSCFPSMDRIAAKCNIDKGTAIDVIKRLEQVEEILVKRPEKRGRGRHNRYWLVLGRPLDELRTLIGWDPPDNGGELPPFPEPVDNRLPNSGGSPPLPSEMVARPPRNGGATPPQMVARVPPDPKAFDPLYKPPELRRPTPNRTPTPTAPTAPVAPFRPLDLDTDVDQAAAAKRIAAARAELEHRHEEAS